MPQQILSNVENNFTQGLKTEYTGLNFPENAATDTDNCIYTLVGNVTRRYGIDFEENYWLRAFDKREKAISKYRWVNAGGDGSSELMVVQVGKDLNFYKAHQATKDSPISAQGLLGTVDLSDFRISEYFDETYSCEYSDGNGFLFVYNSLIDPIYIEYHPYDGILISRRIEIKTRDLIGATENTTVDFRPTNLTDPHKYNLMNQGWTLESSWSATSGDTVTVNTTGNKSWDIANYSLTIPNGTVVQVYSNDPYHTKNPSFGKVFMMSGTVTGYSGTTLTININYINPDVINFTAMDPGMNLWNLWSFIPVSTGYVDTWFSAINNYPSNADVWWRFKDSTGAYNPADTYSNISVNTGNAPRGHFILNEFNQDRIGASGVPWITTVSTNKRPRTGAWFQGRVWYAGVDDTQFAWEGSYYDTYSWTERIYFSQVVSDNTQFGNCYQVNDPTSQDLFDMLPTDGGYLLIQGCGPVFKLFPIQNGMLVFATNGIWFVTGSQGIGFTANDYTITKISSIRTQSSTSFVNVQGLPYFWNEEGIYTVTPSQQGLGLQVESIVLNSILSYYQSIPKTSKLYVKGDYNPLDYTIQWIFKSKEESSVTSRYEYDKILIYNVANKAFYPYSLSGVPNINDIVYLPGTNKTNSPEPNFKYLCSFPWAESYIFTVAEEIDEDFLDWKSYDQIGVDYESYFVTGYKLHGQGQRRFQLGYIYVYSNGESPTSYKLQGIWDYANDRNSGKWTNVQLITNALTRFSKIFRRHKIRGRGLVLQLKISSVTGMDFDINGWSVRESQNTNV